MCPDDCVPMTELSRALDEIYELRTLLAYEASSRERDISFVGFPKSRRVNAQVAIDRMRAASRGERFGAPYEEALYVRLARNAAGMRQTLTRSLWLAERSALSGDTDATQEADRG